MIICLPETVHASGTKIGQATCGENGKLRDCKAGDQSGGEVSISSWSYRSGAYHWKYVFRAKDPQIAKKIAQNMKEAASNNNIGYDQKSPDRNTFYDEAKKANWDISAISVRCETTCGASVSVCLNAAGVKVPRLWYTELIHDDIMKTGMFDCYTSKEYTATDKNLLPGDILCSEGHTAMVVESPNKFFFKVTYVENGKEEVETYQEDTDIYLYMNNGKEPEKITVTKDIDLKDYTPEKRGFKFIDWEKKDNAFVARYQSNMVPLVVKGDLKIIE